MASLPAAGVPIAAMLQRREYQENPTASCPAQAQGQDIVSAQTSGLEGARLGERLSVAISLDETSVVFFG
jgi:hypothetical protein